jgi:phage-related protein
VEFATGFVRYVADLNPLRRSYQQVVKEAKEIGDEAEKVATRASSSFNRFGQSMATTFQAMGKEAQKGGQEVATAFSRAEKESSGFFGRLTSQAKTAFRGWGDEAEKGSKEAAQAVSSFSDKAQREFKETAKSGNAMFMGIAQGAGIALFQSALGVIGKGLGGFKTALFDLNNAQEAASAKINAFTKDSAKTAEILEMVRARAAATPFAFQAMADAAGSLIPVGRQAGISLEDLLKQAEILAASNPMEGLEGASFALREAMTGDFTSIIERFNLSRSSINQWKEEGVSNFEIVQRAMAEMGYDSGLVAAMGSTLQGRWSTFLDTLDGFKIALTKPTFDFLKTVLIDLQGYLDANTERITAMATAMGTWIAGSLTRAITVVGNFIQAVQGIRAGLTGSSTAMTKAGETLSVWEKRAADARATVDLLIGSIDQVRDAVSGDFHGGGMFSEDSPLIAGIFRARDGVDELSGRLDTLAEKFATARTKADEMAASKGITLPSVDMGAVGLGAGAALAGAGAGAGLVAMAPALTSILHVAAPLTTILPVLGTVLGALLSPVGLLAAGVAVLGVAWVNNWGDIQGKTEAVLGAIGPQLTAFGENAKATLGPKLQEAWDGAKTAISSGWEAMAPTLDRLRDYWSNDLAPQLTALGETIGPALSQMGHSIQELWQTIQPPVERFMAAVVDLGRVVMPIIGQIANVIIDSLGPAISEVIGFATETVPLFADAFSNVLSIVGPIIGKIFDVVSTVIGGITSFIQEHSDQIVTVITASWNTISGVIEVAWDLIAGIIQTGLLLLSGNWRGAWDEVKATAMEVWEGIKNVISSAWTGIQGMIGLATEAVKTVIGAAWGWMSDKIGEVGEAIHTKITGWWNGIKTFIDNGATSLKSAILSPFEGARDAIGGIATAFSDKLKGGLNVGITALNGLAGGVASVVNWIAGALKMDFRMNPTPIPALAKGTGGEKWGGGWAWVGEGPRGAGAELAYLPRGSQVIPHRQSLQVAREMGIPAPTQGASLPGFAFGLDIPNPFDIFKNGPAWLLDRAIAAVGLSMPDLPGVAGSGGAFFGMIKKWLADWVVGFVKEALPIGPENVQNMIQFAEAQLGLPYIWGGGHGGGLGGPGVGFDCSGFVAAVLNAGGIPNPGGIVTDFYNWMEKNGGNGAVDIGVNDPFAAPDVQHVGIRLMGTQYESGGPFGGVGKNGTRFSEWGSPPGWSKAKSASALENVDLHSSLENMRRSGAVGQWTKMATGGVVDEPIAGIGIQSGAQYLLGEAGKEAVIPADYLDRVLYFFSDAIVSGKPDAGLLMGIPLELRGLLMRVAKDYLAEARRRAGSGVGTTPGWESMPNPKGITYEPTIPPGIVPDTRGLNPGIPVLTTDTTGLNDGGKKYTAAEQISMAEQYGAFYPGELSEDDPRIVKAIARFRRRSAGIPDTTGLNNAPGVDTVIPPSPSTSGGTGSGSGGGSAPTARLEISGEFYMILPDGRKIVAAVIEDAPAMDVLAGETAKVMAKNIQDRNGNGGGQAGLKLSKAYNYSGA